MNIFESIIQAIVQGITEFLPVSSSGHLSLFQHFTGISGETGILFSLILHMGTLVAVFIAFHKTIFSLVIEFFSLLKDLLTGKFKWKEMNGPRRMIIMLVIALLPMLFFYLFKDLYLAVSSDNDIIIEGICFLATSAMLFIADRCVKGKKQDKDIRVKDALTIGIFQGFAPFPGISRSGSTISAGLISGLSRDTAVQFSFILGIPAILGGSILELKDITPSEMNVDISYLIIGFVVSAVVGFFCIKLLRWLIKSEKFKVFVYYTFILGILTIATGIFEAISGSSVASFFIK